MDKITIAISGPPGAGATTAAKKIAKKLNLRFFSPGLYFKKLTREKKEGKAALELMKTKFGSSEKLHKRIDSLQIEEAERGNVVVEGTLSIHFLKKLSNYKIWIYAPLNIRAQRAAKRDKIPAREALRQISAREKIEKKTWEEIYGFDYFDQKKSADLTIDNSKLTSEQTADKILQFIKMKSNS